MIMSHDLKGYFVSHPSGARRSFQYYRNVNLAELWEWAVLDGIGTSIIQSYPQDGNV